MLIITADDWGSTSATTDAILACWRRGRVTAASGMVYMEDSNRAAGLARRHEMSVGLHLNVSELYTAGQVDEAIRERQARLVRHFTANRWMKAVFNPVLVPHVRACIEDQIAAFVALYGRGPDHIDSHHHIHISPTILLSGALPRSTRLRRTYRYSREERPIANRAWRAMWNAFLARRFPGAPLFLGVQALRDADDDHSVEVLRQAHQCDVEVMTHPGSPSEFEFLMSERWKELIAPYVPVRP